MLVKIIAIGADPAAWREVFHRLRDELPDHPFSVGVFASPEELAFLEREFFPGQWRREAPDFLLSALTGDEPAEERLAFLKKVQELPGGAPPAGVLLVENIEKSLRALLQHGNPLGLTLDNGSGFTLSDPAFLLRAFPKAFPRIRVDGLLQGLRLKGGDGPGREVVPDRLGEGTLVGFAEIEAVLTPAGPLRPKEWLKTVAAGEGLKRAPGAAGLIREEKGMYVFPGIPLDRIRAIELNGVRFAHLLERRALKSSSPHFLALIQSIAEIGTRRSRRWKRLTARIRQAEARTDIPLVCAGDNALLRESLAALLVRSGYPRCYTLNAPGEGLLKEPALMLQVAPWARGRLGAQADAPMVMEVAEEMERLMKPLERMLPWRELPFEPPPADLSRLSREAFSQQQKRLSARGRRVRNRLELEEKRNLLLGQETAVLEAARGKFAELLEAGDTIQVWSGALPPSAKQALVFSHDQEEAGAVLQAMPHIHKKRWFDLSPFTDPDTIQNLTLDDVRHYAEQGVMLITAASRERLQQQQERTAQALETAREALAGNKEALARLKSESQEVDEARERLARRLLWQALGSWVAENGKRLDRALQTLRDRHERRWFNRVQVRRALILPYLRENAVPLLDACAEVYPSFSRDLSVVMPYEFDLLDTLPEGEDAAVRRRASGERLAPRALAERLAEQLTRHNEALFADFLQVVSRELTGLRVDLIVVEHRPELAGRILDHLRRAVPQLEHTPAVLILSELWEPPAGKPLPWSRTRVMLLPRMGALAADDCAAQLRSLYAM
jgi:hypothetical protein